MAAAAPISVARTEPGPPITTVAEGPDWVPLEYRRDILPGSALDFSGLGIHDAPAGKRGWLVSRNGHAEFENRTGVPARFYGVNLCNTANYLSDDEVEHVTDRLVRLGYNAVRFHHHDERWANAQASLDRLIAACVRKGIYLTTDLYVSRRIPWRELGVDRDGEADNMSAKLLMMSTEAGFANWARFSGEFLTHVNPYTGRSLAQEPAMPFLVLINESSPHSDWDKAKALPEFTALWGTWLAEVRAADPSAYPLAKEGELPEKGGWWDPSPENDMKAAFWAWCVERFSKKAAAFLRDENNGPILPAISKARATAGDYVDFHFYTEHAESASATAREETGLPLAGVFRNKNPLSDVQHVYRSAAFARVWGRPVVVSESQMSGPSFQRAIAGLLTGTFAAVQDWTGVWTFALAHHREKLFDGVDAEPGRFDISLDPLMQATDRLPTLLFLRGDQTTPEAAFANAISNEALCPGAEPSPAFLPKWGGDTLEWRARLGVAFEETGPLPEGVERMSPETQKQQAGNGNGCGVAVDEDTGNIVVSGQRTCGGFVGEGDSFEAGALRATLRGHGGLVAVSSLDGAPLAESSRILAWHLTDLHGEGFSWGGETKRASFLPQTGILDWGTSRILVHTGEAEVELGIGNTGNIGNTPFKVFALGTDGRRECEVPCVWEAGRLRFTASVRQPFGGCMYYEIIRKSAP